METPQFFSRLGSLNPLRSDDGTNIGTPERGLSLAGGAALVAYGASRRTLGGALLAAMGVGLMYRGAKGHCAMYRALGIDTSASAGVRGNKGIKVERTIHINRPPGQVFDYWRRLENLPEFMPHLESVKRTGENRSHWVVKGPLESRLEWDAEIINEHPGSMLAWQTLPGAVVRSAGSVRFEPEREGTRVRVNLQYHPVAGDAAANIATLFGESAARQIAEDIIRFKQFVEEDVDAPSRLN